MCTKSTRKLEKLRWQKHSKGRWVWDGFDSFKGFGKCLMTPSWHCAANKPWQFGHPEWEHGKTAHLSQKSLPWQVPVPREGHSLTLLDKSGPRMATAEIVSAGHCSISQLILNWLDSFGYFSSSKMTLDLQQQEHAKCSSPAHCWHLGSCSCLVVTLLLVPKSMTCTRAGPMSLWFLLDHEIIPSF